MIAKMSSGRVREQVIDGFKDVAGSDASANHDAAVCGQLVQSLHSLLANGSRLRDNESLRRPPLS